MRIRGRPSAPILIVDDNRETRDVLEMILRLRGYRTATAVDGQDALDYLYDGNPVCLIILDLRMPIMDGWAVCRALRADPVMAEIPIVAFSANVERELPGAVATIRKGSFDPETMLNVIDEACLQ